MKNRVAYKKSVANEVRRGILKDQRMRGGVVRLYRVIDVAINDTISSQISHTLSHSLIKSHNFVSNLTCTLTESDIFVCTLMPLTCESAMYIFDRRPKVTLRTLVVST